MLEEDILRFLSKGFSRSRRQAFDDEEEKEQGDTENDHKRIITHLVEMYQKFNSKSSDSRDIVVWNKKFDGILSDLNHCHISSSDLALKALSTKVDKASIKLKTKGEEQSKHLLLLGKIYHLRAVLFGENSEIALSKKIEKTTKLLERALLVLEQISVKPLTTEVSLCLEMIRTPVKWSSIIETEVKTLSYQNCQTLLLLEEQIVLPVLEKRTFLEFISKSLNREILRRPKEESDIIKSLLRRSFTKRVAFEIEQFDPSKPESLEHLDFAIALGKVYKNYSESKSLLFRAAFLKFKTTKAKNSEIERFISEVNVKVGCRHVVNNIADLYMLMSCNDRGDESWLLKAESHYTRDDYGRLHRVSSLIMFESFQSSLEREILQRKIISKLCKIDFSMAKEVSLTKEWWEKSIESCATFIVFYYKKNIPDEIKFDKLLLEKYNELVGFYCPETVSEEPEELDEDQLKELYGQLY